MFVEWVKVEEEIREFLQTSNSLNVGQCLCVGAAQSRHNWGWAILTPTNRSNNGWPLPNSMNFEHFGKIFKLKIYIIEKLKHEEK